jgi:hypothetical protein
MKKDPVPAMQWARSLVLLALCCTSAATYAQQTPLFEEIRTVSSVVTPVESAPFNVTTAGLHDITLVDLGALFSPTAPVTSIQLAVMRGATVVTTLNAAGTTQVTLPVGTYVLRVAGQPGPNAGSGLFSVAVQAVAGTTPLASFTETLSALATPVPSNVRLIQDSVTLPVGNYVTELVDLAFPQALDNASIIVTSGAAVSALVNLPATLADQAAFTVGSGGAFSIYALGDSPLATNAGLFMIRIRDTTNNTVVFSRLLPVGRVAALGSTPILAVGQYDLVTADLAFPAALTQSGALVARSTNNSPEVARLAAAGTYSFNPPVPGIYDVFGLAVPGTTPGGGALAVEIRQSTSKLFTAVRTAGGDAASGTPVFAFPVEIINPGSYTVTVTDMVFPAALSSVNIALSQGAAVVARRDMAGGVSGNLVSGRSYVLVAAKPASGTGGLMQAGGLISIQMAPAQGDPLLRTTQGIGGVFSARNFVIPALGDYRFTLDDLGFPANFSELVAAVTRGTERLGLIYGEGSFDVLQAVPGDYVINFISRPDAAVKAGTYYLSASIKPPSPTVTISANPVSPATGGTVDITWSTQNATTCIASNGWTGTRATSGTERSAAISIATTFTLACTGAGGSSSTSLTVTPNALAPNSGGGGQVDWWTLALLAAIFCARYAGQRRRHSSSYASRDSRR